MKYSKVVLVWLLIIAMFTGCGVQETPAVDASKEGIETSDVVTIKPEPKVSVFDIMDYIFTEYPEYNTFVFVDNTVHVMNCIDAPNRTMLDLAREISYITDSSYEARSIRKTEGENRYVHWRTDLIAVEDSDGIWNDSTNGLMSEYQEAYEQLSKIYDLYQVLVKESIPGVEEYIDESSATVTELMGYVNSDIYAGFMKWTAENNKQVFIFPYDGFESKYSKNAVEIQFWETFNPSETSSPEQEFESTESVVDYSPVHGVQDIEGFIRGMLYGEPDSEAEEYIYRLFVNYEDFYGPQTSEQMKSVLEYFKGRLRETVYDVFGKSCEHELIESALQTAYSDMETWWDEETVVELPYIATIPTNQSVYYGPGYAYNYVTYIKTGGTYTIVEEAYDEAGNLWGKLKSGVGWVNLSDIRDEEETAPTPVSPSAEVPYLETIPTNQSVYYGPGYAYNYVTYIKTGGIYTIVEEAYDEAGNLWGKLKSGVGWVDLSDIRDERE